MCTNFSSLTYQITLAFLSTQQTGQPVETMGHAGVLFRAVEPEPDQNTLPGLPSSYRGYFAGFRLDGEVLLSVANGTWTELASARPDVPRDLSVMDNLLRVHARGTNILVFVNDMGTPIIDEVDDTYSSGRTGIFASGTGARFDNIEITGT